ncbi:hypothetical protein WJX72_002138 [[Myrmecia] bisecta]|uniref:Photosystem I reaction center subunit V, chloroplastic n=1 Tax=[Myrmecia] bisecta TaxID=41462 RepID=A0AAW1P0P5_9CHLO
MTTRSPLALQQRSALSSRVQTRVASVRATPFRTRQVTRAFSDTNIVIGSATALSLALGRFVFLPFQRDNVKRQGLPVQNGDTYPEAGDRLAQEASFALKTNDPAGFNIIDVMAWGALGHAVGYAVLAGASLQAAGVNPAPF